LLQVLEGDVSLHIGDETFRLAAGDAVSFRSDVPHAYANDGDARARFSLVVHEPGVGATRANGESM
jgi:quercetin dioxygenase-like cupin family protein